MTGRIESFVEAMHIRLDDRVLEIGCGHRGRNAGGPRRVVFIRGNTIGDG